MFGSVREVRSLQYQNALSPTLVRVSGSVSEVRLVQSENALLPMVSTTAVTTTVTTSDLSSLVYPKTYVPAISNAAAMMWSSSRLTHNYNIFAVAGRTVCMSVTVVSECAHECTGGYAGVVVNE